MKILWLGHNLAYPPKTGPLQRNYNLLREVAKRWEVHVLAFDQLATRTTDITPQDCIKALLEFCTSADWVPLSGQSRYWLALKGLAARDPYELHWLRSDLMAQKLRQLVKGAAFDVVHFDSLGLAQYRHLVGNAATVLNHHDIQSSLISRRATIEPNLLFKQYWKQEGRNLQRAENKWCPKFHANLVVSKDDADLLRIIAPKSNIRIVPNGVDTSYFMPRPDPGGRTLLFCGSLDMYPNIDAMRYFFSVVWPKLIQKVSDIEMYVVGRNPPYWLSRLGIEDNRIHVTGFVDDVRPYFRKATVFVCPIRDGGGTRLKILDSLAMGVPVVASTFAASGLSLCHGSHLQISDTDEQFVASILCLFRDLSLRSRLSGAGREQVKKLYSWTVVGQAIIDAYVTAHRRASD